MNEATTTLTRAGLGRESQLEGLEPVGNQQPAATRHQSRSYGESGALAGKYTGAGNVK